VSRDYVPSESLDPRDAAPEPVSGNRQTGPSDSSLEQGPGSDAQDDARLTLERAPKAEMERPVEPRKAYEFRGRTYAVRTSEIESLTEIGKFRAVASEDLEEFQYHGEKDRTRPDVANLIRQGLVTEKSIPHSDTAPRQLLTLTKKGHQFLRSTGTVPRNQATHYGFTKPREAHHDADLYRLYHKAAAKIERQGGKNPRVVLDYELKKRVFHDLAKLGPEKHSAESKREIAEKYGLQLVRGKIPLPDLRIEYEDREGDTARVDLELATEHYRGSNLAEKVRAGFSLYARAQDAPGLRRVLDQKELTAEILSL
jgi:hypothetical protein